MGKIDAAASDKGMKTAQTKQIAYVHRMEGGWRADVSAHRAMLADR
jgi:hypothetical protein